MAHVKVQNVNMTTGSVLYKDTSTQVALKTQAGLELGRSARTQARACSELSYLTRRRTVGVACPQNAFVARWMVLARSSSDTLPSGQDLRLLNYLNRARPGKHSETYLAKSVSCLEFHHHVSDYITLRWWVWADLAGDVMSIKATHSSNFGRSRNSS